MTEREPMTVRDGVWVGANELLRGRKRLFGRPQPVARSETVAKSAREPPLGTERRANDRL
ncbi:hypothetical protein D9V28_11330 [Mycetocola zhadangensis]|uniref:Uncharacterized protein n=1 Tax=Mycetocola zhadangensis TaxID=1164595 RepID=A0A3L7IWH3_9MICO|nr:hypothetical protein D9V28_11330 [Mycetocola zhadangensis]